MAGTAALAFTEPNSGWLRTAERTRGTARGMASATKTRGRFTTSPRRPRKARSDFIRGYEKRWNDGDSEPDGIRGSRGYFPWGSKVSVLTSARGALGRS